jgi:hypothetical protein
MIMYEKSKIKERGIGHVATTCDCNWGSVKNSELTQ